MDQPSQPDDDKPRVRCMLCGFVGIIDDFDVLLSDKGLLFCPDCGREAPVETILDEQDRKDLGLQ